MNQIVDNFKSVYSELTADNIELVEKIYDDNITFIDPFHEIRGLTKLSNYFSELYKNVSYILSAKKLSLRYFMNVELKEDC